MTTDNQEALRVALEAADLRDREKAVRELARQINAGRKPKFGDKMRNPWASESNPTRDGYFVREGRVNGRLLYEMTDKAGKFWNGNGDMMMFLDHFQSAPAQEQQSAEEVRRMALEEAAKVAEDMPIQYERDGHYIYTAPEDYAAAIRALAKKEQGNG